MITKTVERPISESYGSEKLNGKVIGIPLALTAYDLVPLFKGFFDALQVPIRFTGDTTEEIIRLSSEYANADGCVPIKLLYGQTAKLLKDKDVGFIFIPCPLRMDRMPSEQDQHYTCPYEQNGPYMVNTAFKLEDKLLAPRIDFSKGDKEIIKNFTDIAMRLGFSPSEGKNAIHQGLKKQREFEEEMQKKGQELLAELEDPQKIGVVLLSRSYTAHDKGINKAIADELAKMKGIVPIPMDYLPLKEIDVLDVTDAPYWDAEHKLLAAAKFVAGYKKVYGIMLTNFGCGPDAFNQKPIPDIMGDKPLGHIEIDAHAGGANFLTRLQATVVQFQKDARDKANLEVPVLDPERYSRRLPSIIIRDAPVFLPYMSPHAVILAATMQSFGVEAYVLPESTEESMELGRRFSNGQECVPFVDTLGQWIKAHYDGSLPANSIALMVSSCGPCRIGHYPSEQQWIYKRLGIPIQVLSTVSDNGYADLGLNWRFELQAWQGIVATDRLQQMLWKTRPYEKSPGQSDEVFNIYLGKLEESMKSGGDLKQVLRQAEGEFMAARNPTLEERPKVLVVGEIYVRANRFCNKDLVRKCEKYGLEVVVASMAEWINYVTYRRVEDATREWYRHPIKYAKAKGREWALPRYERQVIDGINRIIHEKEPTTAELLEKSLPYVPAWCASEAPLTAGGIVAAMLDPHFAGALSIGPLNCMPSGVVAAHVREISERYGKPIECISYDGTPNDENALIVPILAEKIKFASVLNE